MSEFDKNPFPKFDTLLPGGEQLKRFGEALMSLVRFFPKVAPPFMSDHYHAPGGASGALDHALYDEPIDGEAWHR